MLNSDTVLLVSAQDVLELPYTSTKTVASPIVQSTDELKATTSIPRYMVSGFNLARWHKEFFAGADAPLIHDNLTVDFLLKLLEIEALEMAAKESKDPSKKPSILDTTSEDAPFIIRVIRARANAIHFSITDTACIFLGCLCNTPGQAVMHVIAAACSWQQSLIAAKLAQKPPAYDVANVAWFLHGSLPSLITLCLGQTPSLKIPSDEHLHKMWDLQKVPHKNNVSDNALDQITLVDQESLLNYLEK